MYDSKDYTVRETGERNVLELIFLHVVADYQLADKHVQQGATALRDQLQDRPWQRSADFQGLDFDDLTMCLGYMKRYAACHCALARHCALTFFHSVPDGLCAELLTRSVLSVVSIGGGPGNDLVGFCSALCNHPRRQFDALVLSVVDLKRGWGNMFRRVIHRINTCDYGLISTLFRQVRVAANFVTDDLAQFSWSTDPRGARLVKSADIVVMTKVLSVISMEQRGAMLRRVFAAMKYRAVFLFFDIDAAMVVNNAGPHMKVLMHPTPRQIFNFWSVDSDSINQCNYEICALQKIA